LVLVEYELKALIWMRNILASKNPNIVFQEDLENIEEGKYLIVPGVLSELLWNAYKHSKKTDKSEKVHIAIELAITNNAINFYIENPIGDKIVQNNTKSGLDLIQKRLKMEYGEGNFTMEIRTESGKFIVSLQLPIK
jgi:LytS/YehU family sensor histidine kinase